MFRFLINWFLRRRARKARDVFAFFDGTRTRKIDPFAVQAGLELHGEFRYELLDFVEAGNAEATATTLRAICDVFDVTPWNSDTERGLTQPELLRLFMDFDTYCAGLKKKYNFGLISPAPTGPTFSDMRPNSDPTNSPSDCTSIEPAPSCAAPLP